ncbi:hypothetical protein [Klebsiella pneumoniae]|uniref:Uncharacterized protein n=1 Tax=Klebsiella pneumoniae TaxID=573 RepID=A0A483F3H9_KLEPN|nr:hypothetical protein [Klebsiella pneumoniae]MCB7560022.1 hypothetical protein [Klebsiella pneumoniae]MCD5617742.1 hypothetical protein [Klebsiella pneumoniae]MTF55108.1 hypothetical protein [Klebsiella pneumoniae]SVK74242.1 Uncharacterised protein [Klebsiella pneumoniae]SWS74713.1 Uncharacterised protein [Klebsiella pneumoniae]
MKFSRFFELITAIWTNRINQRRDPEVTIIIHSPGSVGVTPSVEVESIEAGFDWNAGQVLIYPAQPLTTLTPDQVADITTSVRKGQSWHAYEAYKKHKAEMATAATEYLKVAGQRDELLTALEALSAACDTGERDRDGKQSGEVIPDKHAVWAAREAIARVKGSIV